MLRYSKSKPSHFVSCNVELLVFLISSGNWLTFMIIKIDERIVALNTIIRPILYVTLFGAIIMSIIVKNRNIKYVHVIKVFILLNSLSFRRSRDFNGMI